MRLRISRWVVECGRARAEHVQITGISIKKLGRRRGLQKTYQGCDSVTLLLVVTHVKHQQGIRTKVSTGKC